jgi:hypothetical protein
VNQTAIIRPEQGNESKEGKGQSGKRVQHGRVLLARQPGGIMGFRPRDDKKLAAFPKLKRRDMSIFRSGVATPR